MPEQSRISLKDLRRVVVRYLVHDANLAISGTRGEQGLLELRRHTERVLRNVAKLKILGGSSLSLGKSAAEVGKQMETNKSRLEHMEVVAEALFFLNEDIKQWHVPQFEIMTSFATLVEGRVNYFPSIMEELVAPRALPPLLSSDLLDSVSNKILGLIEQIELRPGTRLVCVRNGIATFASDNEFKVKVTLSQVPANLYESHSDDGRQEDNGVSGNSSYLLEKNGKDDSEQSEYSFHLDAPELCFGTTTTLDKLRWWSLTELTFFPKNPDGSPFLEEFQVEYLRRELDLRMISLAHSVFSEQQKQRNQGQSKQESATLDMMDDMDDGDSRLCCKSGGLDSHLVPQDDQIGPLHLLLDMCRDTASRAILSSVRSVLKAFVAKDGLFKKRTRLMVSKHLRPGYRLYYWTDVPVIADRILRDEKDNDQWIDVRPWLEIGTGSDGHVRMEHFHDAPQLDAAQRESMDAAMISMNIGTLLLLCASMLAKPITTLLFSALEEQDKENVHRIWFLETEHDEAVIANGTTRLSGIDAEHHVQASILKCICNGTSILKIGISSLTGRLRLEVDGSDSAFTQKRCQQWEERINQTWRRNARLSAGATSVHPHVAALGQVAKEVLLLTNQLERLLSCKVELSNVLTCAKHGLKAPFVLSTDLLKNSDQLMNFQQEIHVDLVQNFNVLVKEILCSRLEFTRPHAQGLCWRYQFLLSTSVSSKGVMQKALLVVLALDVNGVPVEIPSVVPIPEDIYTCEQLFHTSKKRKRRIKPEMPELQRERLALSSLDMELMDTPEWREDISDEVETDEGTSCELPEIDKNKINLHERLVRWCCERGLFEALKEQLSTLRMKASEQYSPTLDHRKRCTLQFSLPQMSVRSLLNPSLDATSTKCNSECSKALVQLDNAVLTVLPGGSQWCVRVSSMKLHGPSSFQNGKNVRLSDTFSFLSSHDHGADITTSESLRRHQSFYGMLAHDEHGLKLVYNSMHAIDHSISDLQIILARQALFEQFLELVVLRGRRFQEDAIQIQFTCRGLTDIVLEMSGSLDKLGEPTDDNVATSTWSMSFCLQLRTHRNHQGYVRSSVSNQVMQSKKPSSQGYSVQSGQRSAEQSDIQRDNKATPSQQSSRSGLSAYSKFHRIRESSATKHPRIDCDVQCSIPIPSFFVRQMKDLITTGDAQQFLLTVCLTAKALYQMGALWAPKSQLSKWRLHALPQSTALKWYFLCTRRDIQRTLIVHFHESEFLFVQVRSDQGPRKDSSACEVLRHEQNPVDAIQSLLDKSIN